MIHPLYLISATYLVWLVVAIMQVGQTSLNA